MGPATPLWAGNTQSKGNKLYQLAERVLGELGSQGTHPRLGGWDSVLETLSQNLMADCQQVR